MLDEKIKRRKKGARTVISKMVILYALRTHVWITYFQTNCDLMVIKKRIKYLLKKKTTTIIDAQLKKARTLLCMQLKQAIKLTDNNHIH